MEDFTGQSVDFGNDGAIVTSGTGAPATVPTSQPDFNVAGVNSNPLAILTSAGQAVTQVVGALGAINNAGVQAQVNKAVAQQNAALAATQATTQTRLAQLQSATQIAQATAAFNRSAALSSLMQPGTLMIVLAVATVLIGAAALMRKK